MRSITVHDVLVYVSVIPDRQCASSMTLKNRVFRRRERRYRRTYKMEEMIEKYEENGGGLLSFLIQCLCLRCVPVVQRKSWVTSLSYLYMQFMFHSGDTKLMLWVVASLFCLLVWGILSV